MVLQSQPIQEIESGTRFWEIYEGRTLSGWGQVSIIWEVVLWTGAALYSCRQISNNTVGQINPNYREIFNESEIKRIQAKTPIIYSKL